MKVTVYIRPENQAKWEELAHKSEWVNDLLSGDEPGFERKVRRLVEQVLAEKMAERGY